MDARLETVDGTLEEYRKANAAFYIGEAELDAESAREA
jgi:hypothetical protein